MHFLIVKSKRKCSLLRHQGHILLLTLCLSFVLFHYALAEHTGLHLYVSSDQPTYVDNDTAHLTLTIENTSNQSFYNLDIQHLLPSGLEYIEDEYGQRYFDVIPPNSTQSCTISVRKNLPDVSVTVKSDKKAFAYGEIATLTLQIKNNTRYTLHDIEFNHVLPNGLEYAVEQEDGYAHFNTLAPFEILTRSFLISSLYPDVLVTLEADQPSYQPGDVARLHVTVTNRSDHILKNLSIEHFLPEGLIYALGHEENQLHFLSIQPGESIQGNIYVQYVKPDLPETGDTSSRWFTLFTLCSLALFILMQSRKSHSHHGGKTHEE